MQHRKIQDSPHERNKRPTFGLNNEKSQQVSEDIYREASAKTQEVNDDDLKELRTTKCKSLSYLEKIGETRNAEPNQKGCVVDSFHLRK
jgi:hypothetical protein